MGGERGRVGHRLPRSRIHIIFGVLGNHMVENIKNPKSRSCYNVMVSSH